MIQALFPLPSAEVRHKLGFSAEGSHCESVSTLVRGALQRIAARS